MIDMRTTIVASSKLVSIRPRVIAFVLLVLLCLNGPLPAQLRVQPSGELPAEASLRLMLRKLSTVGTFMETTAHPDDEDNALLAMMSHGEGMRSVLVTATRGDGGQNEIGPEIFQALGVLRTEELLAVHRFDGAEQYFTRAIDFGYSFSLEESIQKWGREEIVGDFVRHIRATRPDVIAGFICGGDGGGQHHQASTRLTAEAFRAAADPSRFPEQIREGLRPWQAKRLFCLQGFSFQGQPAAAVTSRDLLRVSPAGFDPLLGRTYNELGLEARSMHKCQGTSQLLLLPGQAPTRTYQLTDTVVGEPGIAPPRMFDGIDTTLNGLGAYAGSSPPSALTASLQTIGASVAAAAAAVTTNGPAAAAPSLASGLAAVRDLRAKLPTLGLSDGGAVRNRLSPREERVSIPGGAAPDPRHPPRGARRRWHRCRGPAAEDLGDRRQQRSGRHAEIGQRRRSRPLGRRPGRHRDRLRGPGPQQRDTRRRRRDQLGRWVRGTDAPLVSLLDAPDRRGTVRLRAGCALRRAVPAHTVSRDVQLLDRRRGRDRRAAGRIPVQRSLRRRKADGAAGRACVRRADDAGHCRDSRPARSLENAQASRSRSPTISKGPSRPPPR